MASVRFVLKDPQNKISKADQKETLVYMLFNYSNKRLKISTRKKILPDYWNETEQKAKSLKSFPGHQNFNARLNQYRNAITDSYDQLILQGIVPDNEKLKEALYIKLNISTSGSNKITLNDYIKRFVKEITEGTRLTEKKTKYKYNTIRSYRDFKNQFLQYQEEKKKSLNFDDISMEFYDDFVLYFTKKNNAPNTIGRHVKILKALMRSAREEGLHNNLAIEKKKFKTIRVNSDQIYLTTQEIDKIHNVKLDKDELNTARDVFLIGYYTAQRFSDYSRITIENIRELASGVKIIDLVQQKTGMRVNIPIHWQLKKLLEKYDYKVPKTHAQKLNTRIKIIGKEAGIDDIVMVEETKGGSTESVKKLKFDLIKTHTARRSGATNMYLAGIPTLDIMKITGHQTEKEFLKYIRVSKEETAESLSNHSYFKNS